MLSVEKVYETFLSHDVDFFTGVPDSLLKNICAYITDHTSLFHWKDGAPYAAL